jgi:allantoinase
VFDYSPIVERAPLRWPEAARVAFYVRPDSPRILNYGWRDYCPRVGIWRLIESLDRHGMRQCDDQN